MMKVILAFYQQAKAALLRGATLSEIQATGLFDRLVKMKYEVPNGQLQRFQDYLEEIGQALSSLKGT